jgi:dipeptidyl aminopeptidase/acylaminoacyl peptidase
MKQIVLAFAIVIVGVSPRAATTPGPTIDQFLSPAYPQDLVAARKADRIAWWTYERGQRNVYTAAAPAFRPVRLTHFTDDNGVDISDVSISDDGSIVAFARGTAPNRDGWVANPTSDPRGADRTIWAVRTSGSAPVELGEGTTPVLSPDGRTVLYGKDGQIYAYKVRLKPDATNSKAASTDSNATSRNSNGTSTSAPSVASGFSRTDSPLIKAWGNNGSPRWSPDGTKVAFVSDRVDHSFIGVYDVRRRTVTFLSPSVDHDASPTWSPDSKRVAFIRRPGTPFGLQAHQGAGSIGNPDGPAYNPLNALRGRGGRGGRAGEPPAGRSQRGDEPSRDSDARPGLFASTFQGGYTLSFWVADAATGDAHEFWHNAPGDRDFAGVNAIEWAGADHVIFQAEPEEWIRYYSVPVRLPPFDKLGAALSNVDGPDGTHASNVVSPVMLTPGDGMVENVGLSGDGRMLFYSTNAGDIDHRHIWKVPTSGGEAVQLTSGDTIETYPAALASASGVAVLSADAKRPQSIGIVPAAGGAPKIIYPALPKDFPIAEEVAPQAVMTKAADGLDIHNQLFLPKDLKPGERRPAIVFVHGGPIRQMLLGYHYMHFYHIAYAVNQWLASKGYVVLSVNYRSGIGYGKAFRTAPNTGGRGNAEYQDVVAGGRYLQSRPDVDPNRIGIWGLSYGGVLTAQALARNSDIFKAGVDLAGVHLWGTSLDPENVSYKSSAISAIDTWKSPVLLIHGDDDRNVQFSQTTGLVQLLRAHNVPHELIVFPDDTHEPLLHKRWLIAFNRMNEFFARHLKPGATRTTAGQQ